MGQGEAALGLGAVGPVVGRAVGVAAAADGEVEPRQPSQSGDGSPVGVIRPQALAAVRALTAQRNEILGEGWLGSGLLGHTTLSVA
jgi:hypothetical protein